MNTKALRQKILDLAIHGKLVPQDPNDEPASVLLERIRAEKERLIKEGKIKKPKKCKAACDKPHYPFELPKGWEWTTLGEVISIKSGNAIKVRNNKNGSFPIYGGNGISGYSDEYNIDKPTIVIGRVGFYCGSIHYVKSKAWVTDNAFITSTYGNVYDIDFLYYLLIYCNLRQYSNSTAQPVISGKTIYPVHVPVPPIKEQRKIVEKIEFWLSCISQLEFSQSKVKSTIKQAKSKILDLAIHGKLVPQDPNDEPASELLKRINPKAEITCDTPHYQNLPSGWTIIKVGNAAEYINGRAFKPEEWKSKGLPIIRIQNLNDVNAPYNRSTTEYESKYLIQNGNLLFAWAASLGTYIWQGNNAWLNQHIFKVIPHSFIDKEYLYYTFQAMISEFYKNSHGSGMVHITKKQFEEVILLLPPLSEQHRIVKRLKILFAMLDNISDCL